MDENILMVAAEASSSFYALRILQNWKKTRPHYKCYGVGSLAMEAEGFDCFGYAEDLGVVGFREVLPKYQKIKEVYKKILNKVDVQKPKVAVLLDYPGFNLRLAKDLKKKGVTVVYYIAPQVWAWKKSRIKTIAKYVDEVFCILPFEEQFYRSYGVKARFVGHPLLDELKEEFYDPQIRSFNRSRFFFKKEDCVLGLMPGSRHGELKYNFPTQLQVAQKIYQKIPKIKIAILVSPTLKREDLLPYLENFKSSYVILEDDPLKMISLVDVMLCKSGTSTLMVGLLGVPMVIMYKVSFFTGVLGRLLVSGFIGLVNIIMEKQIVPERILRDANEKELLRLLEKIIRDENYRNEMKENLKQLKHKLEKNENSVTECVVSAMDEYISP